MSPRRSVGASWVSTHVSKISRLIGPSMTQGAGKPSWRSAAMNVWVPQWPKGAFLFSRDGLIHQSMTTVSSSKGTCPKR